MSHVTAHRAVPSLLASALVGTALAVAPGLASAASTAADVPEKVTYAKDVAPILNANCVSCHRPGDIAPMALRTYDEVRPWAKTIRKAVSEGTMPPWHAAPDHGAFKNDRSLTETEKAIIQKWVKSGAQPGDLSAAPRREDLGEGWRLGEPDLVVTFDEVSLPGGGPDQFHDLTKRIGNEEDLWLRAVEVKPGNRKVVHHVIIFATDGSGQPQSGWLGAWAAGMEPMVFPEGTAKLVGSDHSLVADMHYHPDAEPSTDQTQIGLYFYDGEPAKELINLWIQNAAFKIPAGEPDHEVTASYTFDQDSLIWGLLPHMHYRGKDFTYTATYPDGRSEVLLEVAAYDFNWQTLYELAEPLEAPAGTRIDCVAHYDNSKNNPDNPDPTRDVTFGNESFDEMMIGFVDYTVKDGLRPMSIEQRLASMFDRFQDDHPGEVYRVTVREEGDDESIETLLWLPAEGDGKWILPINNQIMEATFNQISRDGAALTGKLETPMGTFSVDGTADDGAVEGKVLIPFSEAGLVYEGSLYQGRSGD